MDVKEIDLTPILRECPECSVSQWHGKIRRGLHRQLEQAGIQDEHVITQMFAEIVDTRLKGGRARLKVFVHEYEVNQTNTHIGSMRYGIIKPMGFAGDIEIHIAPVK